jgi:small-conductance mechanosensitive channel
VLKTPPPRVIFEDFGDSALVFALEYWIDYGRGADGRQIASDLRFMAEKALAEAGIAVPYPQRDVHLAADGPVKVEVVSRAEPQALRRDARG